jgi:hypothetical protein
MYNKNYKTLNNMNKETFRMQMLAGIITEGQYKAKLNENESFTPDDEINFKWNSKPLNPQGMLTDESGETFTKDDFWKSDIIGNDPLNVFPNYGNKNEDGTWTLTFDEGEVSGFIEGEDFTL